MGGDFELVWVALVNQTGTPTVRSSSIWRVTHRKFCMRTSTSPSSFMSRWNEAAQIPWYIGAGTGNAEPLPGLGTGPDGELVRAVEGAGIDRDGVYFAGRHLDDEGMCAHVQEVRTSEVLAVRLDFGILIRGLLERIGPLLGGLSDGGSHCFPSSTCVPDYFWNGDDRRVIASASPSRT